eukprot:GHVU01229331.1.p1 GENE.GHVU01229331.1~~GHVU01229331.1.p1  ORF type:complete len:131 (+),score=14.91 GHVU01229331.1:144-536(+)
MWREFLPLDEGLRAVVKQGEDNADKYKSILERLKPQQQQGSKSGFVAHSVPPVSSFSGRLSPSLSSFLNPRFLCSSSVCVPVGCKAVVDGRSRWAMAFSPSTNQWKRERIVRGRWTGGGWAIVCVQRMHG